MCGLAQEKFLITKQVVQIRPQPMVCSSQSKYHIISFIIGCLEIFHFFSAKGSNLIGYENSQSTIYRTVLRDNIIQLLEHNQVFFKPSSQPLNFLIHWIEKITLSLLHHKEKKREREKYWLTIPFFWVNPTPTLNLFQTFVLPLCRTWELKLIPESNRPTPTQPQRRWGFELPTYPFPMWEGWPLG